MTKIQNPKPKEVGYIKPREITREMTDSYIDYAMSVIISRALPDVRDGLKPVQRRILYAMYGMGLKHDAKFRKSATVVGECMGKFHPHGDAAIYDALVRMAQDFSLRYPLVKGQGNFGSIDSDPPAAQRYCITGDSLVVTNRCLERIGGVSTKEDVSLKVLSFGGKINHASKWFDSGVHPVLKIKTFRGYTLEGTLNHPILTLQKDVKGKPLFKWKLLKDIKRGDFAVIDRNEHLWPNKEPSLRKYFPKIKKGRYSRSLVHQLPPRMTPDLAFLMGAIVAEGYISISKKNGSYKVGFCNTDQEFIDEFRKRFKKVFPDCRICEQKRSPLGYGKKKFVSFEICSEYLVEFLKNLGVKAVPSHQKRVPEIIFHSTKKSVAQFLKGYFEGDGGVYEDIDSCWIGGSSSSKNLVREIQTILLRFAIVSSVRYDPKRREFKLSIFGFNNLSRFKEKINFLTKEKVSKLQRIAQRNSDGEVMAKTDYIPFLSQYIREKYRKNKIKWRDKDWLFRHNLDRYPKLQKHYNRLIKILERSDLELIQGFLNNFYLFDSIVSVQARGENRVYSFRVDSKCHSFVSNGFISHNTEAKLSRVGEEILKDIEKETVDFTDNYDGTRKEPVVLPSPLPQLLLNGTVGIAVGMATNIPPHNLSEVCQALIYLLDHPKAETAELLKFIKGPDFPTGGIVYDGREIAAAYSQGKGSILTRGKAETVEGERGKNQIIISEIPFQVSKAGLLEKFAKLVEQKQIDGVKDIRDESDREGMRIVIELSRTAYPQKILNRLYKFTDLQKAFHLNMIALVDGLQPRLLNLADALSYFLAHRKKVVKRRAEFELQRAKERAHILEGLCKCLAKIDAVIKTIKQSKDRERAEKNLIKKFELTKIQAKAILETKLHQLARLEREKIEAELKEKKELIKNLEGLLKSPKKIRDLIKKELKDIEQEYGDARRTRVIKGRVSEISEEDLVPLEETVIILTQKGFIKRVKPSSYKAQRRGGRGVLGAKIGEDDVISHFLLAQTHDLLLFFTDSGKVFQVPSYEIPEGTRLSRGKNIANFLEISSEERILDVLPWKKKEETAKYLLMATAAGLVKKTAIEEFENVRKSGLIAIRLKKGDLLKEVAKTSGDDSIVLISKRGKAIVFKEKDLRPMGRTAAGNIGMRLGEKDAVIGMAVVARPVIGGAVSDKSPVVAPREKSETAPRKLRLLIVSEKGFGKRTPISQYRVQRRGGTGLITAKLNNKTGDLAAAHILTGEEEHLIVISQKGHVIKAPINSVRPLSRTAQGVKLINLSRGDKVASAICV